jgi:hypothetical protein
MIRYGLTLAVCSVLLLTCGVAAFLLIRADARNTITSGHGSATTAAPHARAQTIAPALRHAAAVYADDIEQTGDRKRQLSVTGGEDPQRERLSPVKRAVMAETRMTKLTRSVEGELRDAVWAGETEWKIRNAVEKETAENRGTTLGRVTCASTRCLVEGAATTLPASQTVIRQLTSVGEMPRGTVRWHDESDGTFTFRAVLARPGYNVAGDPIRP